MTGTCFDDLGGPGWSTFLTAGRVESEGRSAVDYGRHNLGVAVSQSEPHVSPSRPFTMIRFM